MLTHAISSTEQYHNLNRDEGTRVGLPEPARTSDRE